ncbi:MAG: N-acetyltransferase [Alphaproteobacteria bacterium]|nr:N-acetyltransferase [Alphaproteobacteria bacterium]
MEMELIGRTSRLILRCLMPEDAAQIQPLADNWEVAKQTANLPFPYGKEDAETFVGQALTAHRSGRELVFAIVRREDERLIGLTGLVADVAPMEVGYWLGQPFWGCGYATEALEEIQKYIRTILSHRRLHAVVFGENAVSIRVLTKCGFDFLESWDEDLPHRGGMRTLHRYQWLAL